MPRSIPLLFALCLLTACCCAKPGPLDGTWLCDTTSVETQNWGFVEFDVDVVETTPITIRGDRITFGSGIDALKLDLEIRETIGQRHYAVAVTDLPDLGIHDETPMAFEVRDDGRTLAMWELEDVDWSRPDEAGLTHPQECRHE